jgi:hypothetical protein
MTTPDKTIRAGKRAVRNARTATTNADHGGEMMRAASDVIAARMTIMAEGFANPMKADVREMSLMGTEKMEAMSASAAAVAGTLGELAARTSRSAMDEMGHAARAASAIAAATTPQGAASAQMTWAMGWWSRASTQMLSLNTELLKAQAEALKPIHAAATANARRLKK